MSSPNLNVVTLVGSGLTYASGYLFGLQEHNMAPGASVETLVQMRIAMLYLGVSLVFGPILGKSWRLYKVFTQRVPDKRVIIKDIQLLGIVSALLSIDVLLLLIWMLSDPVHCVQTLSATVRVAEKGVFCSVTRIQFCASLYSEVWILLLCGFKGSVLIYGTYLAGLTNHVSSPPVNQSLTIMVAVNLVILSAGVILLVTRLFYAWSNLVFGLTSGGIFLCTTTVNCFIFIPQLMQWRQFEEEHNHSIGQMAKFFNSPSKSFRSMYSEEQIYHLLGENNSMKRLLTEKDAVIESLQEQVNNAKDKLSRLMLAECSDPLAGTPPSSIAVSALAHDTEAVAEDPGHTVTIARSWTEPTYAATSGCPINLNFRARVASQGSTSRRHQDCNIDLKEKLNVESPLSRNAEAESTRSVPATQVDCPTTKDGKDQSTLSSDGSSGFEDHPFCHQNPNAAESNPSESPDLRTTSAGANGHPSPRVNYVSSEKLQEILKELSVDTVGVRGLRSSEWPRRASQGVQPESTQRSPEHFRNICLSLSPYMMRRRRGLAYSTQGSYHLGPLPPHVLCMMSKKASRACNGLTPHTEEQLMTTAHVQAENNTETEARLHNQCRPPAFNRDLSLQKEDENSSPENIGSGKPFRVTNGHHFHRKRRSRHAISPRDGPRHEVQDGGTSEDPRQLYTQDSLDSDSSSSEESFCCCHRPFCEVCFQTSCDSSDSGASETDRETFGNSEHWVAMRAGSQPVVNFKDDLRPTFV